MTETLLFFNGYGYSLFHFRQIFIGKSDLCSSIIAERPEILWDFAASTEKHAYTGIKMQALLLLHCLASEYPLRILSPTLPPLFCRKNFPVYSIYGGCTHGGTAAVLCGALPRRCSSRTVHPLTPREDAPPLLAA